jgi:hypothetical protein
MLTGFDCWFLKFPSWSELFSEASPCEAQIGHGVVLKPSRRCPIVQYSYFREKLGGMNRLEEQMEVVALFAGILE